MSNPAAFKLLEFCAETRLDRGLREPQSLDLYNPITTYFIHTAHNTLAEQQLKQPKSTFCRALQAV